MSMTFLPSFLYPHSIAQAFNGPEMEQALVQYTAASPSIAKQVMDGVTDGVKDFARGIFISLAVTQAMKRLLDTKVSPGGTPKSLPTVLIQSVAEELIFRGLLQNGIHLLQTYAKENVEQRFIDNFAFQVLTSTSSRVILTQLFMVATYYLTNTRKNMSQADMASNLINTLLQPMYSIAYEQTGSLPNVAAAHTTRNLIVPILAAATMALINKIPKFPKPA